MGCIKTRAVCPEIISVSEAKSRGLKRYYTGKSCRNGHIAERMIANGNCLDCQLATNQRLSDKDPERLAKYRKECSQRFRDNNPGYEKQAYLKRKPQSLAASKKWHSENREKARGYKAAYKKRNPHKNCEYSNRRRATKLNATPKWLSRDHITQMEAIYLEANQRGREWHVDHVIPLINPIVCGLHVPWNLQIIPDKENYSKNNRFKP